MHLYLKGGLGWDYGGKGQSFNNLGKAKLTALGYLLAAVVFPDQFPSQVCEYI